MARKTASVKTPATFVGTVYSPEHGVYMAQRADGSVTVGRIGQRGLNVQAGVSDFEGSPSLRAEH